MARKFAAVVLSLGCLNASSALALGLGELRMESYLNEPLKAQVNLLNTGSLHEDQIRIRLATKDDFDKMGVERAYFLTSIKFEVQLDDNGRGQIILTSEDPVLEPYLDFIVEARWPSGRLLREYTVLVDPPVFDESAQVISATERVIEVEGEQMLPSDLAKKKTETAVQRTGTHVDVRQSDLPPGKMPRRDFGSDASSSPTPGQRYMIRREDTLWEIARRARPEDASVHQTMLDIQRLNPQAFIDNNINRIKAGYIIYLPSSAEISSRDQASALENVRQQNQDWRAGVASEAPVSNGPALRITADADGGAGQQAAAGEAAGDDYEVGAGAAALEEQDKAGLETAETAERLKSMEQQVETLQRIVNLKDEQIAALQSALAEAGMGEAGPVVDEQASVDTVVEETADEGDVTAAAGAGEMVAEMERAEAPVEEIAGPAVESAGSPTAGAVEEVPAPAPEPEPAPRPAPAAAPAKAPPVQGGGITSYLFYGLGALVLAILGFVFLRRRGGEGEDTQAAAAVAEPTEDVFADVELKDQELEVAAVESAPAEPAGEEPEPEPGRGSRGYGGKKHDEYASDVDTGDALAEADIYIAYGRYPQAIDLLKNACAGESGDAVYRLKLMEIYAELNDRDGVMQQLAELEKTGDEEALSRAQQMLAGMETRASASPVEATPPAAEEKAPTAEQPHTDAAAPSFEEAQVAGAAPEEDLGAEELPLQSDFSELEIEEPGGQVEVADELDLSGDFAGDQVAGEGDQDLVIAADTNGMSTKMDLARAYLDMGDEDGARQILEEVVAEASDDLKAEARALLDRIG